MIADLVLIMFFCYFHFISFLSNPKNIISTFFWPLQPFPQFPSHSSPDEKKFETPIYFCGRKFWSISFFLSFFLSFFHSFVPLLSFFILFLKFFWKKNHKVINWLKSDGSTINVLTWSWQRRRKHFISSELIVTRLETLFSFSGLKKCEIVCQHLKIKIEGASIYDVTLERWWDIKKIVTQTTTIITLIIDQT
jgi:hypothetical protein